MKHVGPAGRTPGGILGTASIESLALKGFIVLVLALVAGAATLAVRGVRLDTGLADLVPVSDIAAADEALERRAREAGARTLRFVLRSDDPALLAAAGARLRDGLDAIPVVRRDGAVDAGLVDALAPLRFSLLSNASRDAIDSGDVGLLVEDALAALYSPSAGFRALPFDRDPLGLYGDWLESRLDSLSDAAAAPAADVLVIGATITDASNDTVSDAHLSASLEGLLDEVSEAAPGIELYRTGVFFFSQAASTASKRDIDRITVGSLLGLFALLLPVFRSAWPLVLPALSILVGAASAFVLVALVYDRVHVLTIVFGASLIGIVIDYSIHGYVHSGAGAAIRPENRPDRRPVGYSDRQSDRQAEHQTKHQADAGHGRLDARLVRALCLSLATSALGYAALGLSDVESLRMIALFSVAGVAGAWLTVLALLPLTGGRSRPLRLGGVVRVVRVLERVATAVSGWSSRVGRRRLATALAIVALGIVAARFEADDDPRRLVELSPSLVVEAERVASFAAGYDAARHIILEGADLAAVYRRLGVLAAEFDAAFGTGTSEGERAFRTLSIADFVPAPAVRAADRARQERLLEPGGALERVLGAVGEGEAVGALRAEFAASPEPGPDIVAVFEDPVSGLPPLVAASDDGIRALVFISGDVDRPALVRAVSRVPGARLVDTIERTTMGLGEQRRSAFAVLAGAFFAIGLLLMIVYRDTASLALIAVPAGAVLGTLTLFAVFSVDLTLFHAVALFLVLGLGMDYVIFIAELDDAADSSATLDDGRAGGHTRTISAILLSAATSLLSFGLLATSDIPVARFFGETVFVGNALNLALTFVVAASRRESSFRRVR